METRNSTTALLAALLLFFTKPMAASVIESAGDGEWWESTTWVNGIVPGVGDDVIITAFSNVDMTDNRDCASLTIQLDGHFILNSQLNNSGPLTIDAGGSLTWTAGNFTGTGTITNNGTFNLFATGHATNSNIINNATMVWDSGDLSEDSGGQTLTNTATGTFTIGIVGESTLDIINAGTILKPATGDVFLNCLMNNQPTGTISITQGNLFVTDMTHAGELILNGTMTINGGTQTIAATADIHGTGTINMMASVIVNGTAWAPGVGTFNHSEPISGTAPIEIPVGTTWNWYNNGSFATTGEITNNGTFILSGGDHPTASNITNLNSMNLTDGTIDFAGGGQILTNGPTATLTFSMAGAGTCNMAIVNEGNLLKTAAGTMELTSPLENTSNGMVDIQTGTLQVDGNITQAGVFTGNGTLHFIGGTHTLETAASFTGTGLMILEAGTFNSAVGWSPTQNVELTGPVSGNAALTIPTGKTWTWSSGSFGLTSPITVDGRLDLTTTSSHETASDIVNHGTIATFDATFDTGGGQTLTNDGVFNYESSYNCGLNIVNTGTISIVAGSQNAFLGQLDNQAGGDLYVASGDLFCTEIIQSGNFNITGILRLNTSTVTVNELTSFTGCGTLFLENDVTINSSGTSTPTVANVNHQGLLTGNTSLTIETGSYWFWRDGEFDITGDITVALGGNLNLEFGGPHNTATDIICNGLGTVNWTDGDFDLADGDQTITVGPAGVFSFGGATDHECHIGIVNNGQTAAYFGNADLYGPVENNGTFQVVGNSVLDVHGEVLSTNAGQTFQVQGAAVMNAYGNLTMSGLFEVYGEVNFEGGSHDFSGSSGFGGNGLGNVNINAPTEFNSTSPIDLRCNLNHNADLTGDANWNIIDMVGSWNWAAGNFDFTANSTITNNGQMSVNGPNLHQTNCNIINNGVFNWNDGALDGISGNNILTNSSTGSVSVTNTTGNVISEMAIHNSGTLFLHNTGFSKTFSDIHQLAGAITGTGDFTASAFTWTGGAITNTGNNTVNAFFSQTGNATLGGGELHLNGNAADVTLTGELTISNGAILGFEGTASPILENTGSFLMGTGGGGQVVSAATLKKNGAGTFSVNVPFTNVGANSKLRIEQGTVDLNGDFTNQGAVTGTGTIDLTGATILDQGKFSPGLSPGTLTVTGNYTNAVLDIEVEEVMGVTTFDVLNVTGTAFLGGTLNVTETGNPPEASWTFLTAGAISGTFSTLNLPDCYSLDYSVPGQVSLIKVGVTKTWNGTVGLWTDAARWIPVGVLCHLDDVVIPSGQVTLDIPNPMMLSLSVTGGDLLNNLVDADIDAPFLVTMGATLNIAAGFTLDINGTFCNSGCITGNGTIDVEDATIAAACWGCVSPGNSAGMLHVKGTHTNDIVEIEIGANGGQEQVDYLDATEEIEVGGELRLSYLGGTVPVGSRVIMECFGAGTCRTGTFATVDYQLPSGPTGINIIYEDKRVLLENTIPITFTGTATWLGGNGNWTDQLKWSSNDIPNNDDDVILNSGSIALTSAAATVKSLTITGGGLSGNKNLTIINALQLGGGQLAIAANTQVGQLSLTGAASIANGTLTLTNGATIDQGSLTFAGGATLAVPVGKTLTVGGPTAAGFPQTGTGNLLLNNGLLKKTGAGVFTINAPYTGNGTTDAGVGTLKFTDIFNASNGTIKGGATLDLSGAPIMPNYIVSPGSSPGTLQILGDYINNSNSVLNFEMLENGGTITKDLLEISGAATLGGILNILPLGGNIPLGSYTILTSNGLPNQQFATVNYPAFCNGNCSIQYLPTGVNFVFGTALPVELLGFDGKLVGKSIELDWATASENNLDGFEVQKSGDGSSWSAIGWVDANGTTSERHGYFFTDKKPLAGANFYRLKITGNDGRAEFSNIAAVGLLKKSGLVVHPNPVEGILNIQFLEEKEGEISLFDWTGRRVLTQNFAGESAQIDLSRLPAGAYWLRAGDGAGVLVVKK